MIKLDVSSNGVISDLKRKIWDTAGIDSDRQRLLIATIPWSLGELRDDMALRQYMIQPGQLLQLIEKLRRAQGGACLTLVAM